MTRNCIFLAIVSLCSVLACSNPDSVDLGRNVGGALSDYAANWDGYAEAFLFDDASDRIRIALDDSGQGTLVVGDQPPPAPLVVEDPNVPPDALIPTARLVPGFVYPVNGARVEADRIRLGVNFNERYRQWCEAQAPVCDGDRCGCIHLEGSGTCNATSCTQTNAAQTDTAVFTYRKFLLCGVGSPCACTAAGCSVTTDTSAQFDGALESGGTNLVGTLAAGDRVTVRMTRQ